jgi:hypothetical protein
MLAIRPEDEGGPRDVLPAITTQKETSMATPTQTATETTRGTKQSGMGASAGVVSELSLFWTVKPGKEQELRGAIDRFIDRVGSLPPEVSIPTGLRDVRLVVFDHGTRFLFGSSFETDWDNYIDDVLLTVGMPYFLDWVQHLEEGGKLMAWAAENGVTTIDPSDPRNAEVVKRSGAQFKALLQERQVPAERYANALGQYTMPEIFKAAGLMQAFQQVLDDPAGAAALQAAPALKPLLDQAAS